MSVQDHLKITTLFRELRTQDSLVLYDLSCLGGRSVVVNTSPTHVNNKCSLYTLHYLLSPNDPLNDMDTLISICGAEPSNWEKVPFDSLPLLEKRVLEEGPYHGKLVFYPDIVALQKGIVTIQPHLENPSTLFVNSYRAVLCNACKLII